MVRRNRPPRSTVGPDVVDNAIPGVDWVTLVLAPVWGVVVAAGTLLLAWVFRRPLRVAIRDLGIRSVSIGGLTVEWVTEQALAAYRERGDLAEAQPERVRAAAAVGVHLRDLIHGRRILWVDDVPENNANEMAIFRELGVRIEIATATEPAVAATTSSPPDLVISDWQRKEDAAAGPRLAEQLRDAGLNVPVVFYVGKVFDERRVRAALVGAAGITHQPDQLLKLAIMELAAAPRGRSVAGP